MSAGTLGTLLTDSEARAATGVGVNDDSKAALLRIAQVAVSQKIAQTFGTVIYGTVTGELHCGGGSAFYLKHTPVVQVVQVVEYDNTTAATLTAESNSAKGTTAFIFNPVNGRLSRRESNAAALFPAGVDNVSVTYVAGRCATVNDVDERFKLAAALTLKNAWRAWEDSVARVGEFDVPEASFPTFTIPKAVRELLGDEIRAGSGTGD